MKDNFDEIYECSFWLENRFLIKWKEMESVKIKTVKKDFSNAISDEVRRCGKYDKNAEEHIINHYYLGDDNGDASNHIGLYLYIKAKSVEEARQRAKQFARAYNGFDYWGCQDKGE